MDSSDAQASMRMPFMIVSIPFGLVGLAGTWVALDRYRHLSEVTADVLLALAAGVWAVMCASYGRYVRSRPGVVVEDLLDQVGAPFASTAVITPMLLAVLGVYPHAPTAGRVLVDVFLTLTVVLGAWFAGQWIYGRLQIGHLHPGFFLPAVTGGLVGATCAARVGQRLLAEAMFGFGFVWWIVLGSVVLARLLIGPAVPEALTPTLAIEIAPAAVASVAYFSLNGDHVDFVAAAIAGYGGLVILAQLRLLPAYLRLPFGVNIWSFAFSWSAVATSGIYWLEATKPSGYAIWEFVVAGLISAGIGALVIRTGVAVGRDELREPRAQPAAGPHEADPLDISAETLVKEQPMSTYVLERAAQKFADATAASPFIYDMTPIEARKVVDELQAGRVPKLAVEEKWITVQTEAGDVRVRIVKPVGASSRLPVVLYLHGGGWVVGNAGTHDRIVRELAVGVGAAVVFVEYALAPDAQYPVQLEQAYATARWVTRLGGAEGLDASRMAVAGDSVGGNMTAVLALLAKQRGDVHFLHQSMYYPVTDAAQDTDTYRQFKDGPYLTAQTMAWFWDNYCPRMEPRREITASPLRATVADVQGLPPALVIVDENDVLRDEGEAYGAKLRAAGIPTTTVRYDGIIHDFMTLNPLRDTEAAKAATRQAISALREALGIEE